VSDDFIFQNVYSDGTVVHVRTLSRSAMLACPHFIMVPEHYRDDDTCRCDDPDHLVMAEWEYTWDGSRWQ
jgi:hypothetical protein